MLPHINTSGYTPQQIMMTLAGIAYAEPTVELPKELSNTTYATKGQWKLVWGPVNASYGINLDNLMYVVQQTGTNTLAVVVRGTVLKYKLSTLVDLYEYLGVTHSTPWRYPSVPGSQVAGGTLFGLDSLTSMTDTSGRTVFDFLNSFAAPTIYVTGHSLGGCLTTVLAPWLLYQLNEADNAPLGIYPYTFAAPTAGNSAFAAWYNAHFPISARYFNAIDVIPKAWNNLAGIKDLFASGPPCPTLMRDVIDLVNGWLENKHIGYTQTNGNGLTLPGISTQNPDWFPELGAQHDHNYYLKLLGAPVINTKSTFAPKAQVSMPMQTERPI